MLEGHRGEEEWDIIAKHMIKVAQAQVQRSEILSPLCDTVCLINETWSIFFLNFISIQSIANQGSVASSGDITTVWKVPKQISMKNVMS